jgi:dihydroflavonol-4-reductase
MGFFDNKRILVTGGTGHLGSTLVHCLVQQMQIPPSSIRVFYLQNTPTDSLNDINGLDMFPGNVLNADEVAAACKDVQLVFHTIGSTTFDTRQKKIQWLVNVEGTRNVLDACSQSPAFEKLCYTSTVNTLAIPNPVGIIGNFENSNPYTNQPRLHTFRTRNELLHFTEQAKNNTPGWEKHIGIGYYDSKLAAQELVNEYVTQKKLHAVSVLPGTMFGPYDNLIGTGIYLLSLYKRQMPVVSAGGLPLAHVIDVAEGHLLAMEKAKAGSSYILSGTEDDNRYLKEMTSIMVDVLKQKFPDKQFKAPQIVVPKWLAMAGAMLSEWYAKTFNKPMLLSCDAVRAGQYPAFYTSANAIRDLGYKPKRTFRQGVEDMVDYYKLHHLFEMKGRYIDKR